jgi:hypothetical protein
LGHWHFKHGAKIEEPQFFDLNYNNRPEERLANLFAAYLLMPPWLVKNAFLIRGFELHICSSVQVYTIACQLGVGYNTLVTHLQLSLGLITSEQAKTLLKTTPKQIRKSILGDCITTQHLIVADRFWESIPIDMQVGDIAIVPDNTKLEGSCARILGNHGYGTIVQGSTPGIGRVMSLDGSWAAFLRVSRQNFEGRAIYRHLEDSDVD